MFPIRKAMKNELPEDWVEQLKTSSNWPFAGPDAGLGADFKNFVDGKLSGDKGTLFKNAFNRTDSDGKIEISLRNADHLCTLAVQYSEGLAQFSQSKERALICYALAYCKSIQNGGAVSETIIEGIKGINPSYIAESRRSNRTSRSVRPPYSRVFSVPSRLESAATAADPITGISPVGSSDPGTSAQIGSV